MTKPEPLVVIASSRDGFRGEKGVPGLISSTVAREAALVSVNRLTRIRRMICGLLKSIIVAGFLLGYLCRALSAAIMPRYFPGSCRSRINL